MTRMNQQSLTKSAASLKFSHLAFQRYIEFALSSIPNTNIPLMHVPLYTRGLAMDYFIAPQMHYAWMRAFLSFSQQLGNSEADSICPHNVFFSQHASVMLRTYTAGIPPFSWRLRSQSVSHGGGFGLGNCNLLFLYNYPAELCRRGSRDSPIPISNFLLCHPFHFVW